MPDQRSNRENRREFSRITVQLPIDVRLVPPEERPHIRARVSGRKTVKEFSPMADVEDRMLAEWLRLLDTKLDTIIRLLTFKEDGLGSLPYTSENISGGGLTFISPHLFSLEDVLEIKIMFSAQQSIVYCLYGEVVKTDKRGQDYLTSVRFIALDEAIRDDIVRFVFEMEREALRKQRG